MSGRPNKIGGSTIGAILGVNPYMTPFDAWLQLTGQAEPIEENETIKWGNVLEGPLYAGHVRTVRSGSGAILDRNEEPEARTVADEHRKAEDKATSTYITCPRRKGLPRVSVNVCAVCTKKCVNKIQGGSK